MQYSQLIDDLYSLNVHGGIKLGLKNSLRLNQLMGYPTKSFESIHVAGTNGKGSVVTKIAKALQLTGLKVGLYTSPHLSCFRERIKINDLMISEYDVERLLPPIFSIAKQAEIPATFFEMTTCLAFHYFAQEKVDVCVVETGLGGRLDATNILTPQLTAITSISLEHTEILGHTIEKIALEKAGIIKPHTPIIIGPHVPYPIIHPIAEKNKSPCIQVLGEFNSFDQENRAIARQCLETLQVPLTAIEKGLEAIPPCRMEIFKINSSQIILDVAHNPNGFSHLLNSLRIQFPYHSLKIICGLSKTKDIPSCLKILKPHATHFYPVEAPNGRGISKKELYDHLIALEVPLTYITRLPTISQSIAHALKTASNQEIILICGSFFIMSEARQALGIIEPRDAVDMNEQPQKEVFHSPND